MSGHPDQLSELDAVSLACGQDIARAAALLRQGLSVLIHVTHDLVPYLSTAIAATSGCPVRIADVDGVAADPIGELASALAEATASDVVVVPDLDVLAGDAHGAMTAEARRATMLLRRNARTARRAMLAFLDPCLRLPDVLLAQFDVHLVIDPPPPLLTTSAGRVPLGRALVTRAEAALFSDFAEAAIYPQVAGLSVVAIRRLLAALASVSAVPDGLATPEPPQGRLTLARLGQEAADRLATAGSAPQLPAAVEAPGPGFGDVAGYTSAKSAILEMIDLLRQASMPEVPRGLLLYGPAGVGKTMLARAAAGELSAMALLLRCGDLAAGGEKPAHQVRQAFARARRIAPSVLVLDDVDALDDAGVIAVREEIAVASGQAPTPAPLLVMGTASGLDRIDARLTTAGLLRSVPVPLPDLETRRELAAIFAGRHGLPLSPRLCDAVAQATDGFSGGELREVFLATWSSLLAGAGVTRDTTVAEQLGVQIGLLRQAMWARQAPSARDWSAARASGRRRTRLALLPGSDLRGLVKDASGDLFGSAKHVPADDRAGPVTRSDDDR